MTITEQAIKVKFWNKNNHAPQWLGRLRERNTSMLTFSGLRQHLTGVTILPAVLNILSEAVLVAQMHMYFLANLEIKGNLDSLSLHHIRGSAELSSASSCRYLDSSASACSLFVKPCVEGWAFLFCSRSHSLFFFGGGAEDVVGTSSSAAALSDTVKSKGVAFTLSRMST